MILASFALIAATCAPAPKPDDPVQRAREAYEDERFEDAARAFEQAYAQDPRPKYLYAQAQALRQGGDCVAAIDAYDVFLATNPPAAATADAQENRARCASRVAETNAESSPPQPVVAEPPPAPPRRRPREARPWYADPWGGALSGVGLTATIAGAVVLANAHAQDRRAHNSQDDATYLREFGSAPTTSRIGIGVLAAGGALLTAGVVRYAVVARRRRPAVVSMGLGPSSVLVHIRW